MLKAHPASILFGLFVCVAAAEPPKAPGNDAIEILSLQDPEREHAFVAQLLGMAKREDELQASLKELSGSTGLLPAQLDPNERKLLTNLEAEQAEIEAEFIEFQKNLLESLKLQGNERLNELRKAIGTPEEQKRIQKIREKIQLNHSYVAMIEAARWSEHLRGWASKLKGPREAQGKDQNQ